MKRLVGVAVVLFCSSIAGAEDGWICVPAGSAGGDPGGPESPLFEGPPIMVDLRGNPDVSDVFGAASILDEASQRRFVESIISNSGLNVIGSWDYKPFGMSGGDNGKILKIDKPLWDDSKELIEAIQFDNRADIDNFVKSIVDQYKSGSDVLTIEIK